MKTLRHTSRPGNDNASIQRDFRIRLLAAFLFIFVLFSILAARFVHLQIHKRDEFTAQAASNRISLIPTAPIRGEIVDANGVVLARNYPAYSLEIIPSQIKGKLDDTIAVLKTLADITESDLNRFQKFRTEFRSYEKIPLKLKLTPDEA